MKTYGGRITSLVILFFVFISCNGNRKPDAPLPNIIYILADDLGYGELGCYGQKIIETPHLDLLAATGKRFTQHYTGAPVCAPARCILLTGKHSGHAFVRGNDEWAERGEVWNYEVMFRDSSLEGQRPMPAAEYTLAEMLKSTGYRTGMVGKWGLGAPGTEGLPNRQGFDFFYGYNCQRQAHTLYPMHLWENDKRVILKNEMVAPNSKLEPLADPMDSVNYRKFHLTDYAPELMHRAALKFIREQSAKPFFLYYASPLPHVPLQAPSRWVDHYRNKIGPEAPYLGDKGYFPCQFPRATYAAMISYLDEQVGDLVRLLKELDIYENTLIIFSSDNGPTYAGGADTGFFESAGPFSSDFGRAKGFLYEGGIRVPMIVSWPGKIEPGSVSEHVSYFPDVFPTLADIAGVGITGLDGLSFLPELLGKTEQLKHPYLYWEFPENDGQQAIRMGNWKGVRQKIKKGNLDLELYDLQGDPGEIKNLAAGHPEIVLKMEEWLKKEHVPSSLERFRMEAIEP